MRLDVGVSLQYCCNILAVVVIVLDSATTAGKTTEAASFSVWFRAEPGQPRRKDMRPDKLNRLIGSDYDGTWMSKTAVAKTVGGGGGVNVSGVGAAEMVAVGPDYFRFPEQLPAQYHEMMRSWLMHRGSCPVEFTWMDLGKSFWPRWIKQGRCGPSESASCSWPPGMSCTSSSVKVLNLLRWHCWLKNRKSKRKMKQRKNTGAAVNNTTVTGRRRGRAAGNGSVGRKKKIDDKFRCLWIKVPYPVTEECTCSCRKFD